MAKKKKYGKTAKQWDVLYNRFKDELKHEKIEKYTKVEFQEVWNNRKNGETAKDIARHLRKDKYLQYELRYKHQAKKGFELSEKLSLGAFKENMEAYKNIYNIIEYQRTTSKKQAKKMAEYLERMNREDYEKFRDLTYKDFMYDEFFEDNNLLSKSRKEYLKTRIDLAQSFKNYLSDNDLWDEVYSYGG